MAELGSLSPNPASDTETVQSHDQYNNLSRLMLSAVPCEKASPSSIDFDEVPAISNKIRQSAHKLASTAGRHAAKQQHSGWGRSKCGHREENGVFAITSP